MKKTLLLMIASCVITLAFAQKKRWNPVYFNFGVDMPMGNFGQSPLATQNAKQNLLNGYYGIKKPGYLFEMGTRFYFNSRASMVRVGLDWTIISANYNEMDWNKYAAPTAHGGSFINPHLYTLSSKLGPVVSVNVVDKLIVDAHFQAAAVAQFSQFDYSRTGTGSAYEELSLDVDDVSDLYGGIKLNGGISVRWRVIGLAADYFFGKLNTPYTYTNTSTGDTGSELMKEKIKTATLQLKLTLNL